MECKACGKKYHHCTSCGSDWPRDEGWCCTACFHTSPEWIEAWVLGMKIESAGLMEDFRKLYCDHSDDLIDAVISELDRTRESLEEVE